MILECDFGVDGKMELGLKGKVAVVTGASRGIGKAIALALASEGAEVVLAARGREALSEAADEAARYGVKAFAVPVDLARPSGPGRLIRQSVKQFGRIDILVNNLGGPVCFLPFLSLPDANWRATLNLDLMVAVRTCRAVIPLMQRVGGGRIINIASIAGIEVDEKFPDYSVAKAALIAFGKYLSVAFASDNILVNTVCPGSVWTSSWEAEADIMAKQEGISGREAAQTLLGRAAAEIPLGKMGDPVEIGKMVAFLSSPNLTWMTGATIRMDGGKTKIAL